MHTWCPLRLKGALLYGTINQKETWTSWNTSAALTQMGTHTVPRRRCHRCEPRHCWCAGVLQGNAERAESHGHAFIWMHMAGKMHTGTKLLVGFCLLPALCSSFGCLPLNLSPCLPSPSLCHPHMLPLTAFTLTCSLYLSLLHIETFLASWFFLHRLSTHTCRSPWFTSGRVHCHS